MATKLTQTGAQVQDAINSSEDAFGNCSISGSIEGIGSGDYPGGSVNRRAQVVRRYSLPGDHLGYNLAGEQIVVSAVGSGGNVASNSDIGLTITAAKNNFLTTDVRGEVNGLLIYTSNGGATDGEKSATNGIVIGTNAVENVGWAGLIEGTTDVINSSGVSQRTINVQVGVLNTRDNDYYGYLTRADRGTSDSAFYGASGANGTFTDLIRGADGNVVKFKVSLQGLVTIKPDNTGNTEINFGNTSGTLEYKNAGGDVLLSVSQNGVASKALVVPNADGATLTAADTGKVYTNEGATAGVTFTLPTAAAGLEYTFIVADADGITVTAASGDTIRVAGSVTPAAGNVSATTIGNVITLKAINATEWFATSVVGTWTVSS